MAYKEIQVPSETVRNVYTKTLLELEPLVDECHNLMQSRFVTLRKFSDQENAKWDEYKKNLDYWEYSGRPYNFFRNYEYPGCLALCGNPLPFYISAANSALEAAELADNLTMTQGQVQQMLRHQSGEVLAEIRKWMQNDPVYESSFKDKPMKPKEPLGCIKNDSIIKPVEQPSNGFWLGFAVTLGLMALLGFIIF